MQEHSVVFGDGLGGGGTRKHALFQQAETVYLSEIEYWESLLAALVYVFCLQARKYTPPVLAEFTTSALPSATQFSHRYGDD